MTTKTPPSAGRLPIPPASPSDRKREIVMGLLSALAILLVVVGVPVALLLTVGNPLPTTAPSTDWLTAQITGDVVLRVLSALVWLAWAHFVACLVVEWRAGLRGRGLPRTVFLGGGSQQLARKLVSAVLLLAGTATLVPQASTGAMLERPAAVTSTVQAGLQAGEQADRDLKAQQARSTPDLEKVTDVKGGRPQAAAQSYAYYEVRPPEGRHHDCLWDIAERYLGDPLRYRELFSLNKDRVQPDGRTLTDADLIRPGWILRMPADAQGPGLRTVDPVTAPTTKAPTKPVGSAKADAKSDAAATSSTTGSAVTTSEAPTTSTAEDGWSFGRLGVGGGLLAAGLLVALTGRRGPYGAGGSSEAEQRLRLAADPGLAGFLDAALRTLSQSLAGEGRALPEAYVVFLRSDELVLHFSPLPDGPPPAPWTASEDGRSWKVAATDVAEAPEGVPAPYPALVNVGVSGGYEVLVDIEAAPGLISIGGQADAARGVASSIAVELGTNLWSDGVRVTLVGFGDDLSTISPQRLANAPSLDAVLQQAEADRPRTAALLRSLGVNGVLQGRAVRDQGEALRPHVLVLSGPPTEAQLQRLNQLAGDGRGYAVLCVGDAVGARWRFTASPKGPLDLGVLGFSVDAHRLRPEEYAQLRDLLAEADRTRAAAEQEVPGLTPRAAVLSTLPTEDEDRTPPPGAPALLPVPFDPTSTAPVSVQLLGPVAVAAPGPVAPERRELLTELVIAAALTEDGLHDAVLRASVWPRGVEDDVVGAAVRDAQEWLGRKDDGAPRLFHDEQGRWRLANDVRCDWDVLRTTAGSDSHQGEAERLRAALELVRGGAFTGTATGRYAWLAFHRSARDARLVGTAAARRLSALAASRGDAAGAEWALRRGLMLVPASEVLWRDLLRLLGGDDPTAASTVAQSMYAALGQCGITRAEAQTDALVQQLAPGFETGAAPTSA